MSARVFLESGIAASEQTWRDGNRTIARFFEAGQFCSNFTSILTGDVASDDLIAMTEVSGIAMQDGLFRRELLDGGSFGKYLRLKLLNAHLFAKELVCAKTSSRIEIRYQFLERYQPFVIDRLMQKDVARFLGVTPQGLSRFLRRRKPDCG